MPPAWATRSTARSVAVFEAAGRRSRRQDLSRSVFRRRRPGAHHLHRLRRLHGGMPLQRQEHASTRTTSTWRRNTARGCSPKRRVVDVAPLNGKADGSEGYEVRTVKSTAWLRQAAAPLHLPRRGLRGLRAGHHGSALPPEAEGLAAGDQRSARQPRAHQRRIADRRARPGQPRGSVARASPSARASTSTNTRTSRRCAIPAGSDAMGLLATLLTGGRPGLDAHLLVAAERSPASLLRHPIRTVRCLHPFGWARESLILLCMQTLDGHIDMRLGRPWFWPFRKMLVSQGQTHPDLHSAGQRIRAQGRQHDRRHAHEHGHGDPVRRSRHRAHPGRLPDGGVAGAGRGGRAATASSATGTCTCATARCWRPIWASIRA